MIFLHLDIQCNIPSNAAPIMERMLFVSFAFVHTRRLCTSCLSLGAGKCVNPLANCQGKLSSTINVPDVETLVVRINLGTSDSIDDDASHHDCSASIQVNVS